MRGFPLLRLAFVISALVLLAIPVARLAGSAPARDLPALKAPQPAEKVPFDVLLNATPAARLAISIPGQPAAISASSTGDFQTSFTMDPRHPEDINISADFGDPSCQGALRIRIHQSGKNLVDTTLWGTGSIRDAVGVPSP